ncbi:MAG: tRNA preQ1(34) S-adenosylmethionine ribosyltransferase-isomerase QueA, partial [Planctomycetes bacterium RBG_16_59_8]
MTRIDDYDYLLPPELIAQTPSPERDASRLLTIDRATGEIGHHRFRDILQFLRRGDLLVLNDTRVIPARIAAHRPTGGRVRALLVERLDPLRWLALLDSSRRLKEGERLSFGEGVEGAIVERRENGKWLVEFSEEIEGHLRRRGEAPLPPYIRRPEGATTADSERYQTVYAEKEGAIAAPTAGLHFTRELLAEATANGIEIAFITLHVGMGTFKPIACEEIEAHRMEAERFAIDDRSATAIENARRDRRRIIAVGTTSCRTLEAYARSGERS